MAIKPIILYPDPRLRKRSQPVTQMTRFEGTLKTLVSDMFETMYHAQGIGLAAIQIGLPLQIVTIDLNNPEIGHEPLVLINPKIVSVASEWSEHQEGCLSIPNVYSIIKRPAEVTIEYQDTRFERHTLTAKELLATCVQHEIDHVNGVLFIDHLSKLKRDMVLKKHKKSTHDKE